MDFCEYVWNGNDNQWKCMWYVWKVVNMYEMLMKTHENAWICIEICEYVWHADENQWKHTNMYGSSEYVWNAHDNKWKCMKYVWRFMNIYMNWVRI